MFRFQPGDPVPYFQVRAVCNPVFHFDSAAGRYIVLCFFGSAGDHRGGRVVRDFLTHAPAFDEENLLFCGVSNDPEDERLARVADRVGFRFFWDHDWRVASRYGIVGAAGGGPSSPVEFQPLTLVLDERLRTLAPFPIEADGAGHVEKVMAFVRGLPPLPPAAPAAMQAPVLIVPRVFEPEFCRRLIEIYQSHGGMESGFMRDVGGRTVAVNDPRHKRRKDCEIQDAEVRKTAMHRIHDRLVPEIYKAFQFRATRMERYIVACYDASYQGFFRAHRDNTTRGTAHRRFAVSINLNSEEFQGGDLRFPEYGRRLYRPPTGGACVFSCSLLHEATPVTQGVRYVFLPFLYDEAAAKIREENNKYLGAGVGEYRA